MNMAFTPGWVETNQRLLGQALARVRHRLEACANRPSDQTHPTATGADSGAEGSAAPALETLCSVFALSEFERDVLLLCAGVELDSRFGVLCATLAGDPQRRQADFSIALGALEGGHWSALAPDAPLRRWRLLEIAGNQPLTTSLIRIDECVLHYLTGINCSDERLHGLLKPCDVPELLAPSQRQQAERLAEFWRPPRGGLQVRATQLCGRDEIAIRALAAASAQMLGLRLLRISAADLPQSHGERIALARLCDRELALGEGALLVECGPHVPRETIEHGVVSFVREIASPAALAVRDSLAGGDIDRRLDVTTPTRAERRALWRALLGERCDELDGETQARLVEFSVDEPAIRATLSACGDARDGFAGRLWATCREQARPALEDLAQRIEPAATWDDLVLPPAQRAILQDVALHVRRSATVFESWGFAGKGNRGMGITALFAGPSGTGKTMAAEVLANELRLDLFHIDLSQVVSKYIGETEKNLRRIFDAAERACAILLFDEADALFGKRSEIKDSHDRYANIEVSYLLQRMEAYRGLAILTTNMKSALDPAFLRRLRFVLQFPFPDTVQRAEIWRRVFPRATPTDGLDHERLARLNVAGGNIRNIALNAAFLAAGEQTPVRMRHLKRAAQNECSKLEKPVTAAEFGGWE